MPSADHRTRCTIGFARNAWGIITPRTKNIYGGIQGAPTLYPNPLFLVALLAAIAAYELAHNNVVATRAKGAATIRAQKRDLLWTILEQANTFVQGLCDASPNDAIILIETACLAVVQESTHTKDGPIQITQAAPGAPVYLQANVKMAKAGRGKGARSTQYNWRGTNNNGQSYAYSKTTPTSRYLLPNVPPGVWGFQVCITDFEGDTEWSQTVAFTVR